jgi:hypothetical protein
MTKYLFLFYTLVLVLPINGCINIQTVKPEYLLTDTTKDIIVNTSAAQSIRMSSNNYQIIRNDSLMFIQGKGTVIRQDGKAIEKPFQGTIPFSEIYQIEAHEKTLFYYSGYFIFGAATAFIILVIIAYGGRGAGG